MWNYILHFLDAFMRHLWEIGVAFGLYFIWKDLSGDLQKLLKMRGARRLKKAKKVLGEDFKRIRIDGDKEVKGE